MGLFDLLFDIAKNTPLGTSGSWGPKIQSPLKNPLIESFVDNVIRDAVSSPAIGGVVYCDLRTVAFEEKHSGIYIGGNRIVHLNGDGLIESVTPKEFLDRLGGFNLAISVYTSCRNGSPVGSGDAANLAKTMIGKRRDYSLVFDNCHQFTAGCLSGQFDNPINFFSFLKSEAEDRLGASEWRVWNY